MTEVAFHFNVPDKLVYTCRLLRKACRARARVVVTGDAALLQELDRVLWTFEPLEFVPHVRAANAARVAERQRDTPVQLLDSLNEPPHQEVLVNLGPSLAAGFESFKRLIEVVSGETVDRQAARSRWKHYEDRGYNITRHDVAGAGT